MQLIKDYLKASNGAANASLMTIQSVRAVNASTTIVNTVANVPGTFLGTMGTPHNFTDPVTGETITIISEATAVDFAGHIDAGKIEIDEIAPGYTDLGSKVGDIIVIKPTTRYADLMAEYMPPTGSIIAFAGTTAPSNWLICDGASLLRADYPRLFNVIGTVHGSVDGTHFNLPDLRDRSIIGAGTGTFTEIVTAANVNIGSDLLTVSTAGGKQLLNGNPVTLTTSGTAPGGLTAGSTYYVIAVSSTTIKLATSVANAVAGTAIDITSQGTGNHTLTLTFTTRAVGERGGEEAHADTTTEMPSHAHGDAGHQHQWLSGNGGAAAGGGFQAAINNAGFNTGGPTTTGYANITANGGSAAHNNMSPFTALNQIIKT